MPIEVLMPALSPTMEKGNLAKWHKKEGDAIKSGDVIAEIETDKATMEVEAIDEGTLGKILVPEGTNDVAVNTPIAMILPRRARTPPLLKDGKPPARKARPNPTRLCRSSGRRVPTAASRKPKLRAPGEDAVASAEAARPQRRAGRSRGDRNGHHDRARSVARRHGGGDAPRPDVFVMGEEVAEYQGAYKVTQGLLQEFGAKRVSIRPITEHGFTGLGVGAALPGLKPIVEFMTFNFAMQAIDQLINSAAKTRYMSGGQIGCSIVFRGPNGAGRARRRPAQPGLFLLVLARSGPQGDRASTRGRCQGPAQVGDPRSQPGDLPRERDPLRPVLPGAEARRLRGADRQAKIARAGNDVTIVAWSIGMTYALKAADELAKDNISAEVIDLRTLKPMDIETIVELVKKTGRIVTVEEGWQQSGVGAEIAAQRNRAGVRLSRRAGRTRLRQGRADALRGESRKARAAVGRRGGRGGQGRLLPVRTR